MSKFIQTSFAFALGMICVTGLAVTHKNRVIDLMAGNELIVMNARVIGPIDATDNTAGALIENNTFLSK